MKSIPYGKPCLDEEDLAEMITVLKSGWLTTGPKVAEFEKEFAAYVGSKYAVAVSSGTAALELALASLEINSDHFNKSEVITTAFTFVATANSILYNNLKPVFVDIKPDTLNIDPEKIREAITEKTKAIIYVDYAGQPCNIDEIKRISEEHDLFLIEDAAHAVCAEYKGKKVGTFADLTTFSFHPVKNMTTGEGGMITTDNEELYKKLLMLRNHGLDKNDEQFGGTWSFNLKYLGRNYRLTDFQCALGISQLKSLDRMNRRRKEIVDKYKEALSTVPEITFPNVDNDVTHAWHLFVILFNGIDRNSLFNELKERGVSANVHYIPIYNFDYYKKLGYNLSLPVTEDVFSKILTLPLYSEMSDGDVDYVIESVEKAVQKLRGNGLSGGKMKMDNADGNTNENKINDNEKMKHENMKIGIIGCGSIGKRHLRNVKALLEEREKEREGEFAGEVIAFDVNQEVLDFVSKEYSVRTTNDLNTLFEEVDGVFICTPNHLHASQALEAVKNNCHVLVEKPLAHSMENVDELLSLAKEKGLTVTVGYMLRFYEPLKQLKSFIDEGKVGKVYGAMVHGGYYLPDWRPTLDYRKNYGAMKVQGGGCILDCIHEINYVRWLLGDVETVYCLGGRLSNLELDTEDYANISLKFKNGTVANVQLDYLQRAYSRGCKIIGEKGTLIWDFIGHKVKFYDADKKSWAVTRLENVDFNKTYMEEEKHFLDCVEGKAAPVIDGEESKKDLQVALAALESLETSTPVRL